VQKTDLYDGFARTAGALASGRRIEILDVLAQGERAVEELAAALDITVANCSQHLQVLRRVGLVVARREGNRVVYGLASDGVGDLLNNLRNVSFERSAEVRIATEKYLGGPVEVIGIEELQRRLSSRRVILIDVRPEREFRAGHIAGARSMPIDELAKRLDELAATAQIVAYCRGRYCALAHQAVRLLTAKGRKAVRLSGGYPEWRLAGLPVEAAS